MKIAFTMLLMCLFDYSMGQDEGIKIGNINFKMTSLFNGLSIYRASCENRDHYLFASQSVIRYDSVTSIGYLRSYNYIDNFYCQERIEYSVIEQLKNLLSEKRNVNDRIGIVFSMEDKNKEFIAVLFLFKERKFKKFTKRANKIIAKNYAGEKILVREYDYHRYSQEFIVAKIENKLSLISSPSSPL